MKVEMITAIIEVGKYTMNFPEWVIICFSFLLAFTITYSVIPSIVTVSNVKSLCDKPGERKSHKSAIPTLGGSAVFIGMIIPVCLFGDTAFDHYFKYFFAGLLILFFIGIKDDILVISPSKKLLAEVFAITLIVVMGNIRLTSLHGFLGIHEIPYMVSVLFTIFMFIVLINGFNLIDGIDGLASGIGIFTLSCLGVWFFLLEEYPFAAFCFSVSGALVAFFRFNVFGRRNRIFLGDTGSLIIGMVLSVFTVLFLESSLINPLGGIYISAPAIAFGLLIIPLIDTLRVFTLRILAGRSPFTADRFHTHHQLLSLGLSHLHSTLILIGLNLLILVLTIAFRHLGNIKLLLLVLSVATVATSIPGMIIRHRQARLIKQLDVLRAGTWMVPTTIFNIIRIGRTESLNPVIHQKGILTKSIMDHDENLPEHVELEVFQD